MTKRAGGLGVVLAALDVDTGEEALELARALTGVVGGVKLGSKLFTKHGPGLVEELGALGLGVFLDLKFHDIPNTVHEASRMAAGLEPVRMLTIHASGGPEMVRAAADGVRAAGREDVCIVAVTALTSLGEDDARAIGVDLHISAWVERLGALALEAGANGLVCSAREVEQLRALHPGAVLVTPGIRPSSWAAGDDQKRVTTPADAMRLGSSHLVIGRPIYRAEDPRAAAEEIARELGEHP